jgi:hypothetical protein
MPIIIVQGSTQEQGKKVLKNAGASEKKQFSARESSPFRSEKPIDSGDYNNEDDLQIRKTDSLSHSSSKESFVPLKDFATNMADVLDFKIYKVSKPHFVDGSTTVALVGGDLFYNDEEGKGFTTTKTLDTGIMKQIQIMNISKKVNEKQKTGSRNEKRNDKQGTTNTVDIDTQKDGRDYDKSSWMDEDDRDDKEKAVKLPSLLQKIRAFRHVQKKKQDKSFVLQHVDEDSKRFKRIKAGKSLHDELKEPVIEDVIEWAIRYVKQNEAELVPLFFELEEKIRKYESELARYP